MVPAHILIVIHSTHNTQFRIYRTRLVYELLFRQKGEPRDFGDIVLLYTFKIHLYISFISPTHKTQP